MDGLQLAARRLAQEATRLTEAVAGLHSAAGLAPAALAADAPGRLGELGRAVHARWTAALDARVREAHAVAADLATTADAVRDAAHGYAGTDHAARQRHPGQR
ncbi:hypothetical protein [Plantactinospora sp. KBS50]|uniref:hypothetical protein n=1 Tax=Plantactinospora sp. KBS50 TaxID=2024580 RepID=UPI000BAABED0|nr:hypothetical protein [Plantactinospora sp. KBS50]ASW53262.1 hypothetical protein CIK06_02300 [Plantactinospora sp. KBS50]